MEWRNTIDSDTINVGKKALYSIESDSTLSHGQLTSSATSQLINIRRNRSQNALGQQASAEDSISSWSRLRRATTTHATTFSLKQVRAWFAKDDGPRRYRGWRKAVVAAAIVTAVVLLANVTLAVVAAAKYDVVAGVGTLYTGDCRVVSRWNTALHLLINVLGTCLLSASSFTMQCLSSPTRSETDRAHAMRKSLEVGVPSITNLSYMRRWKGCLWWALCLSTLPLHLFWNSTVFSTLGANDFNYLVVDESFFSGAPYLTPNISEIVTNGVSEHDLWDPAVYLEGYRAGNFTRMEASDCLTTYMAMFVTSHRNFIAVTSPVSGMRMSPSDRFPTYEVNRTQIYNDPGTVHSVSETADIGYVQPLWNGSSVLAYQGSILNMGFNNNLATQWACLGWPISPTDMSNSVCDVDFAREELSRNGTWWLRPWDGFDYIDWQTAQAYPVDYCLAESQDIETCQLQYASYILVIVICCNVIKLAAMCATARYLWNKDEPIFATIGDAVSSYILTPDATTAGWCLADHTTVKSWQKSDRLDDKEMDAPATVEIYQREPVIQLFRGIGRIRWWITMSSCVTYLFAGIALLLLAVDNVQNAIQSTNTPKSSIWSGYGLGKVTNSNLLGVDLGSASKNLVFSILIANSFQLVLSMTYFLFNSLWTAQCSAIEWASYVTQRKALRVTWPRGQQRSTYYLNLPYKYGIPLTAMLALLHFMISQSIFLARVKYTNPDGTKSSLYISDAAFSPLGILISVCIGASLILAIFAHGFRGIDNRIPVHGNSSVVISALCHSVKGQYQNDSGVLLEHPVDDMSERRVMWGVVKPAGDSLTFKNEISVGSCEDQLVGHCAFTADLAEPPEIGKRYR